jgi:hypothetical protein
VVALVELTARFDEERNIEWAQALEKAGAHVVYGVVGLKTHAKISLVVRREADGIRRYAHVGTGNYNSTTARIYEDVGLLTADEDISNDVAELFNYLTGYSRERTYRKLLVAPSTLRQGLDELIREQSREGGRIVAKTNGVVDSEMIELLYEASQAGAEIDLVVRAASAAWFPASPACPNGSGCGRSSAGISSTPASCGSGTPPRQNTSSARATSCRGTWTAGSRRTRRSRTAWPGSGSTRSSACTCQTRPCGGSSTRTAPGDTSSPKTGSTPSTGCTQLTSER